MEVTIIFVSLLLVSVCLVSSTSVQKRIVGGNLVANVPLLARVNAYRDDESYAFGGGCFISDRVILTQANLVKGYRNWRVIYGSNSLASSVEDDISCSSFHQDFNWLTFENDIALLRTTQSTETRKQFSGTCLFTLTRIVTYIKEDLLVHSTPVI